MPRFEEKVGARLRRDPSDLASYYSCSFIKRDSGGNSNSTLLPSPSSQNGYSRATAFRTSPFTRVNGSRVLEFIRSIKIEANGSLSRAKEKHTYIYIYIHIRNEDLFVVGPCPNRHVTNGVTSVTDTDLLSLSLSLFGYLRSRSDL